MAELWTFLGVGFARARAPKVLFRWPSGRARARTQGRKKSFNLFLAGHLRSKLTKQSRTPIPYHLVAAQWAALLKKKVPTSIYIYIYTYIYIYIYIYLICFRLYTYTKVLCGSLNRWSHQMPTRQCSFVFFYRSCSLVASLTCSSRAAPKTMLNRKDGMPHHDLWLKCFMIGCAFQ